MESREAKWTRSNKKVDRELMMTAMMKLVHGWNARMHLPLFLINYATETSYICAYSLLTGRYHIKHEHLFMASSSTRKFPTTRSPPWLWKWTLYIWNTIIGSSTTALKWLFHNVLQHCRPSLLSVTSYLNVIVVTTDVKLPNALFSSVSILRNQSSTKGVTFFYPQQ